MSLARAAILLLALVACGDRSTPAGGSDQSKPARASASPAAGLPATRVWSRGDPPVGDAGPSEPALIAAGNGRLAVATRDGCLELLEGATGKSVARRCEKDAVARGLAVVGGVAILAREKSVHAFALDHLHDVWTRDTGNVHWTDELARPGAVDGRFCFLRGDDLSGRGIECLDPATGQPGEPWTIGGFRVAFGERLIGLITSHRPKSLPYSDGLELMVEVHTLDRAIVAERAMAGRYGPRFVQARPVFVAETDGERGRTRWVLDRDGRELVGEAAERATAPSPVDTFLRSEIGPGEEYADPPEGPVYDGDMAYAIVGGRVQAYRVSVH
jgi:hypothetical protein